MLDKKLFHYKVKVMEKIHQTEYEFEDPKRDSFETCCKEIRNYNFCMRGINWNLISLNWKINLQFVEKYHDKINWKCLVKNNDLPEKFLDKYSYKFTNNAWEYVIVYQNLSEDFIIKHFDKLKLFIEDIFKCQNISENLIQKILDDMHFVDVKSNLYNIFRYQNVSFEFIKKYYDNEYFDYIINNEKINYNIKQELEQYRMLM